MKAAYAQVPQDQIEEDIEDQVLEMIRADVDRLQEETEDRLRPLKEELAQIEQDLLEQEQPEPLEEIEQTNISEEAIPAQQEEMHGDELAGVEQITKRGSKKKLKEQGGLLVVASVEDIENLLRVDLLSIGIMGNVASPGQRERIAELVSEYADGRAQVMLPLDESGRKAMWKLVQQLVTDVHVRVARTSQIESGRFKGKAPSNLTEEELNALRSILKQ